MSRRIIGKKMVITINITRGASGTFFAKSKQAPTFLASHSSEDVLREALPFMMKLWAEENGYGHVSIRVLPARESKGKSVPNGSMVRLGIEVRQPELAA